MTMNAADRNKFIYPSGAYERCEVRALKVWMKVLAVLTVIAVVMVGTGILSGVLDVQRLLGHDDPGDSSTFEGNVTVHFINVGQGDSILIQYSDGSNVLIDAGGNRGSEFLISYLHECSVQTIDALFITHPHTDHINYVGAVMEEFDVERVYMTDFSVSTVAYNDLLDAIEEEGCPRLQPSLSMTFEFAKGLKVLFHDGSADIADDSSIVLRLDHGNTSFLFAGDMGTSVEQWLLEERTNLLDVDILKVSNHGSVYTTSDSFLSGVSPDVSVISVGENPYGHPSVETLDRLIAAGSTVYTTMENGNIVVTSNGSDYSIVFA